MFSFETEFLVYWYIFLFTSKLLLENIQIESQLGMIKIQTNNPL